MIVLFAMVCTQVLLCKGNVIIEYDLSTHSIASMRVLDAFWLGISNICF